MATQKLEEAIRIVLETEGREGVEALRKALAQLGDSSSTTAAKADALSSELAQLADTSANIRNYTKLKATLSDTGTALEKAKLRMHELAAEMSRSATPTKTLEVATSRAATQVERLTKLENTQQAELTRTSNALRKAGVDTQHLGQAYTDLQQRMSALAQHASGAASGMEGVAAAGKTASGGIAGVGDAAAFGSKALGSLALRFVSVAAAAVAAEKIFSAVGSGIVGAVRSATTLEETLSRVQAVSGATAEEMVALKEAAEKAGRTTKFSTLEAAQALDVLARATGSAKTAIEALPAALNLAQASGIDVAQAADFIVTSLTQFGLAADQAGRVADVFTVETNSTRDSVEGLGLALSYAAPLANQLGLSIEDTAAVIGVLAEQGYKGERAGTALRNVFSEMLTPTSAFAKALRDLGIDSTNFIEVLGGLGDAGKRGQEALLNLDAAARPAIVSLVNSGSSKLLLLEQALQSAAGAAEKTAQQMSQNLGGATESIADSFDRTRRSLVEPLLEPLRQELLQLANELEAFASTPEFEEIKTALKEMFVEGAEAARVLFSEIDFKALAVSVRNFVKDASDSIALFRENLSLIVGIIETVGDAFSITFNSAQTVILGLAAAVAKVLQIVLQIQKVMSAIPRSVQEWATGSTEATDQLNMQIGALGAVYDNFAARTAKNFGETIDATKDLWGVTEGAADAVADASNKAAAAAAAHAAASEEQAAASDAAAEALDRQGAAAQTTAEGTTAAASQMEQDAKRLELAFADLGIQSQVNLQRAAESAKRNFELIREAVGSGKATAEDARRALAAYAQAARAAVADSSSSAKTRTESELTVLEAIYKVNDGFASMSTAGRTAGDQVSQGADQASRALSDMAENADKAAGSVGDTGNAAGALQQVDTAAQTLTFNLGELSQQYMDAWREMNKYAVAGSPQLHWWANLTNKLTEQREELAKLSAAYTQQLGQYDETAQRRDELRKQYSLVSDNELNAIIQQEQQITTQREQQQQKLQQQLESQREIDESRLTTQKQLDQSTTSSSSIATQSSSAGTDSIKIEFVSPATTEVTGASKMINAVVDYIVPIIVKRVMEQIKRSRAVSNTLRSR